MTYSTAYDTESAFDAGVTDLCKKDTTAQDAKMPDIYANPERARKPEAKITDHSSPDIDRLAGFDPYDTGVLQQQKIKD